MMPRAGLTPAEWMRVMTERALRLPSTCKSPRDVEHCPRCLAMNALALTEVVP
jgi:hypothetical protein